MKLVKNNTALPVFIADCGITIAASGQYEIQIPDYMLWSASLDVIPRIDDLTLTISNGTVDFSAALGRAHIAYNGLAQSVVFNNETNGFVATNVQAAIEEIVAGKGHFSFDYIQSTESLLIPVRQQMLVSEEIEIDGILDIEGKLVLV